MLVSIRHRIAFAHYPKTAGVAVGDWFRQTCPDAEYLVADNPHLPVRESLDLPRMRVPRHASWAIRSLAAVARRSAGIQNRSWAEPDWRVFGVIRDPFEMLVSLYEFWRSFPFPATPSQPVIRCARNHGFRDFVAAAVIGGVVSPYDRFFDRGGPLWNRTTLIEFEDLANALPTLCERIGLPTNVTLRIANRTPDAGRDLGRYANEIGSLMDDIHRHFSWYYARPSSVDGLLRAE